MVQIGLLRKNRGRGHSASANDRAKQMSSVAGPRIIPLLTTEKSTSKILLCALGKATSSLLGVSDGNHE
jgi:hypothetical protein